MSCDSITSRARHFASRSPGSPPRRPRSRLQTTDDGRPISYPDVGTDDDRRIGRVLLASSILCRPGYTTLRRKVSTSVRNSVTAASTACDPLSTALAELRVCVAASLTLPSTETATFVPSAALATLHEI